MDMIVDRRTYLILNGEIPADDVSMDELNEIRRFLLSLISKADRVIEEKHCSNAVPEE